MATNHFKLADKSDLIHTEYYLALWAELEQELATCGPYPLDFNAKVSREMHRQSGGVRLIYSAFNDLSHRLCHDTESAQCYARELLAEIREADAALRAQVAE